jgi:hypothetical protein
METLSFSVRQWKRIIYILENFNIPSRHNNGKVKGGEKAHILKQARILGHKKISLYDRIVIQSAIKDIGDKIKDKHSNQIIKINLDTSVYRLIKSQTTTPLN